MAAKTTLNAKNLEALGAQRLAELLIEISTGSAAHKQRLRMALAGTQGSEEVARGVRKRLSTIARARTYISWRKVKTVKLDLETQRKAIVETIAADDSEEAFDLIWQFLALAEPVLARSRDGNGTLVESFHRACADFGALAQAARIDPERLAARVLTALQTNDYGQFDPLIAAAMPALGPAGLDRVKRLLTEWAAEPAEDASESRKRDLTVRIALQEIADAQGDVDAYIAQQPAQARRSPVIATDIAHRLLAAGRAPEALAALDTVDSKTGLAPLEWEMARADVLEALGRGDEAQAQRWNGFTRRLEEAHLRAYLRRLPDFDDVEAEERAFSYARTFADIHVALAFFLRWPSPSEAARLILTRDAELDGNLYELLSTAAEALSAKYPLAATLALRSMIDFTLETGRASRYKHAARHLADCATLAPHINGFGDFAPHETYIARLRREHGRKSGFWVIS